jgi:DNA polymerase-3 subunit epsilon|tara:strand:+ start:390 stop:1007 length:618 start_codon:yes stop_codon:yes gene_type:complete
LSNANSLVILDFETTGLSPTQGDRTIEIGAVRLVNGEVTEQFQQLMNPGRIISPFIEDYTGITNHMLKSASPCSKVMVNFVKFIGDDNLIAHNAAFDKRFLDAELSQIDREYPGHFSCSLLLARRVFQGAPSYNLGNLISYLGIKSSAGYHRALFDAEMTAKLWSALIEEIQQKTQLNIVPFTLIEKIVKTPKKSVANLLASFKD